MIVPGEVAQCDMPEKKKRGAEISGNSMDKKMTQKRYKVAAEGAD